MKMLKIALLFVAGLCSFQFAQAQGITLHNINVANPCPVTVDISWSLGCSSNSTTSHTLTQRCQTLIVNPPVSGESVETIIININGSSPAILNVDPCSAAPKSGNTGYTRCLGTPGNLIWDDFGTGTVIDLHVY